MTEGFFKSAEELKAAFKFSPETEKLYERFTPLINRKAGFSVQRNYPATIRFKPPHRRDCTPDTVAIIHVVYLHPEETKKPIIPSKVPLILFISPHSRYLSKHFDYDFDDEDSPTEESVRLSKSTPRPMELEMVGEYTYNHDTREFQDKRGVALEGITMLNNVFDLHCATIHVLKGFRLRWKLGSRSLALKLLDVDIQLLKLAMRTLLGRSLEPEDSFAGIFVPYKSEDMKLLKTDSISVFGYKASQNVIMTFSFIVLVAYTISYAANNTNRYVSGLLSNALLLLCSSFMAIWILDKLVPRSLLTVINALVRMRKKVMWMRFKF
jgi:hypothetical protein